MWPRFFTANREVSSQAAPGGAVKQLAFDSTAAAKTNMADDGAVADVGAGWFRKSMWD